MITSKNIKVYIYFSLISLFPFLKSCGHSYGFPLPVAQAGPGFMIDPKSINIWLMILNATCMFFISKVYLDLKASTIAKISATGIRYAITYHIFVAILFVVMNLMWLGPLELVDNLSVLYIISLYPLEPFIRNILSGLAEPMDASMRAAFVLMTIQWYMIGYLIEFRRAFSSGLRMSNWAENKDRVIPLVLAICFFVVMSIPVISAIAKGMANDRNGGRKPNKFEHAYLVISRDLKTPELCYKISPDAIDRGRGTISRVRSECFYNVATSTGNLDLCQEVKPLKSLTLDGYTYTKGKCRVDARNPSDSNVSSSFDAKLILTTAGYADQEIIDLCTSFKKQIENYRSQPSEYNTADLSTWKRQLAECRDQSNDDTSCIKEFNRDYYGRDYCAICNIDCDARVTSFPNERSYDYYFMKCIEYNRLKCPGGRDLFLERMHNLPDFSSEANLK